MLLPRFPARWAAVAVAAVAVGRPAVAADPPAADLPPDLAFVHPDALAFAHVRLAEVWAHPELKPVRGVIEKAGPKALAALDQQFVPKPSTIESATVVVLPPPDARAIPRLVAVARFAAPVDKAAVRRTYAPNGKPATAGKAELFADEQEGVAMTFPDDRTVAFSDPDTLTDYLTLAPKPDGGLATAVRAAAGKPLTAAVNVARLPLPPGLAEQLPDDFRPLLKARVVTLTVGLDKQATVDARATFPTAADATAAEAALRKAAEFGRAALNQPRMEAERQLYGDKLRVQPRPLDELPQAVGAVAALGGLATLDEILADLPVKTDGTAVAATVTLPPWMTQYAGAATLSAGLMLPAAQKMRQAGSRAVATNNLKQIALAMHNYHDAMGSFPPAAITDKKTGKPLLSWRVAILPYIEQQALYNRFKLDEPWDSENNKALLKHVVKVYEDPRAPSVPGKTYYKLFVGKDTAFPPGKGLPITGITDGTSNTIMLAAGGEPVIWTKPDDIPFDPEQPLPDVRKPFRDLLVAFCDGSVRVLKPTTDPNTLKALITASGGEVVPND